MRSPCASTKALEIASPSPARPPASFRLNISKTPSRSDCGIPGPSSATVTRTDSGSALALTGHGCAVGSEDGGVLEQVREYLPDENPVDLDNRQVIGQSDPQVALDRLLARVLPLRPPRSMPR